MVRSFVLAATAVFTAFVLLSPATARADEMFYVEQCRLLDTRALGTPIPNGTEYSFRVRGQVGGSQGGAADCGAPIEASGVMIQVVAINALGTGHLEVYPFGNRPALPTSRLNYSAGVTIANEILVRTAQPYQTATHEVTIRPAVSGTHLVVDLVAFTTESNPTFPIVRGRVVDSFAAFGHPHILVETVPSNNCGDETTCFEIECSNQPGAGEVCEVASASTCIEVQGYRRPYSSPRFEPSRRMVGTVIRLFGVAPCPWE